MANAKHTLEEKLELAMVAILSGVVGLPEGLGFHLAFDSDEIEEPAVLVAAQDNGVPPDEEAIEPTGNRRLSVGVVLQTHSDFGRAEHNQVLGMLRDALMTDDIASRLSAEVTGFTVFWFQISDNLRLAEENSFRSAVTAEVWAAPSDF